MSILFGQLSFCGCDDLYDRTDGRNNARHSQAWQEAQCIRHLGHCNTQHGACDKFGVFKALLGKAHGQRIAKEYKCGTFASTTTRWAAATRDISDATTNVVMTKCMYALND